MAAVNGAASPVRRSSTLRARLRTLIVVAGAALSIVVVLAAVVLVRLIDRQQAVTETYFTAITRADGAYIRLLDAETGLRGFALTGDPVTLEPYDRALADDVPFRSLAGAAARDGSSDAVASAARAAADASQAWNEEFAVPAMADVRASGTVGAEDIERGKTLFDDARVAAQAYIDALRAERDSALGELHAWTWIGAATVALLVLSAVGLGVALWVTLRRWIVEPLDDLAAQAQAVSSGDLHHRVVVTGPGEITDLADDVDRMRTALVDQVQVLEAARREVAEANQLLTEQAQELVRSNRDLEQFAYVASHDLQEPLRKVASFTQLLQKRYGGQLDERADQYIEFAVDGAKRMQRLIQDLLGFSRVGRVGGEVTDVDLGEALAIALDQLSEAVADSGAVVTHDELPVVQGEAPLLVQLLQNLVANGIKFHRPDVLPSIHVSAHRVADSWELECRDNGIGIDAQYAERVFVIFQRLHPKDVYEGTGIGLALCKKIVEFHGGRIWIAQPDGPGTAIRWTLPAPQPAPHDSHHESEPSNA
ncbi:ATP-binding protein [Cellulomonas sp. URHE0023]|uniref:sensor histidine kinase n=1 Tax=Cellulomonas sp. URHE0023 TaxID=1380354 RepID=UPI000554695D|nr:ATP-binding protein [Cellulomonas sp. URHE0023]